MLGLASCLCAAFVLSSVRPLIGARISIAKAVARPTMRQTTNSLEHELLEVSDAFVDLARSNSFAVKEGIMHNFGVEDCNDLTSHGVTCFANNPSSPYGVPMVPPPDGQNEDWSLCGTKWMPLCKQNGVGEKVGTPWHMTQSEAVVVLGVTPPEVRYFGFVNYLYSHTYPKDFEIDSSLSTLKRCWEKGSSERKCDVFASLGDALNHGNLKTNSSGNNVFEQKFAMVITASDAVYSEVEGMLKQAGMSVVNALPLPGDFLDLGFGQEKDTILNLLRTAFPTDTSAYETWLKSRFYVYRLTPKKNIETLKLYAKPEYCSGDSDLPPSSYCLTPRSVTDEASRVGTTMELLQQGQAFILDKIKSKMGQWSGWHTSKTDFIGGVPDNGYMCLELGQKCMGDTRDTYYPTSSQMVMNALKGGTIASKVREALGMTPLTNQEKTDWKFLGIPSLLPDQHKRANLSAADNDAMLVVGVIHSATKSAEYSSLSVYDLWKLQGIMAVSDFELAGSADAYLKGTQFEALSPYLYVVEFTRGHCGSRPFCKDVPSSGSLSIPLETPLLFIERMYYDPLTHVGLDPKAAVPARMIHMA